MLEFSVYQLLTCSLKDMSWDLFGVGNEDFLPAGISEATTIHGIATPPQMDTVDKTCSAALHF